MQDRFKSSLIACVLVLLYVTGATLLTALLRQSYSQCTFIFFSLAVLFSSWRGGYQSGFLSVVLSAGVAEYFFFQPLYTFGPHREDLLPISVFVCVATLITTFTAESRSARRRLSETSIALEAMFQASPLAVIAIDDKGSVTAWNRAAEQMFGWRATDVLGQPNPIIPSDKLDEHINLRIAAARTNGSVTIETQRQRRDGQPVEIRISAAAIRGSRGEATGTMALIEDITIQKHDRERIVRLATAVEQAAECIVITDSDGVIQYVNPAFELTTGYIREEVIGQTPRILKSGKQDEAFYERLWASLRKGDVWTGRFTNRKKDGTLFEEEATISPVRDASGQIVNFVAVKRDITKEVGLEHQLLHSQKMEAVGKLAGGVAHDFNNLLTAIIGYSQFAQRGLSPSDSRRSDIQEIEKAGLRAAALTGQLLAFSRKQVFQPKILDCNALLTDLQKMLKRLIGEDIEISALLDLDIGYVKADPGQLQQVITNLVVNARDAMPGGGKITVETSNVDLDDEYVSTHINVAPGPYVMIAISDNGCGMSEETQSHIFEPFFTTKELGRGTGLGLSTVFGIVKQSGGYIWVYSEIGCGTTFKIYLPRIQDCSDEESESKQKVGLPRGNETVLVVEDDGAVREMTVRVLRDHGYQVLEASNGSEALELMSTQPASEIKILVTDVVMPQMDGQQLAAELISSRQDLRVLYVSGYTDKAIVHQGVLDAKTPFLQKPFTPGALVCRVRDLLDGPPSSHCPPVGVHSYTKQISS